MPAGGNMFGLTNEAALSVSATNHEVSVQGMVRDLNNLIADMENDILAMNGAALPAFRVSKNQLFEAFSMLANKYGVSALAQAVTSNEAHKADEMNHGEFTATQTAMQPISTVNTPNV